MEISDFPKNIQYVTCLCSVVSIIWLKDFSWCFFRSCRIFRFYNKIGFKSYLHLNVIIFKIWAYLSFWSVLCILRHSFILTLFACVIKESYIFHFWHNFTLLSTVVVKSKSLIMTLLLFQIKLPLQPIWNYDFDPWLCSRANYYFTV